MSTMNLRVTIVFYLILTPSLSHLYSMQSDDGNVEWIIDSSVEFSESKPDFTAVGNLMGFTAGTEPSHAPEQSVLMYYDKAKPRFQEKILAREGYDGRQKVTRTSHYPFSCFGHMKMRFSNEDSIGSAVLIGPYHALTAAHCVWDCATGKWAESAHVYFGLSGNAAPYGAARVVRFYVPRAYIKGNDSNYDLALIVFDQPIGIKIGYLGCLFARDIAIFEQEITITGYPGDKGGKEMWSMSNVAKKIDRDRLYYDIDTFGGQSGCPIWSKFSMAVNGLNKGLLPMVVGIHTYGEHKQGQGNSGTRLTEEKFTRLIQAIGKTQKIADKFYAVPGYDKVTKPSDTSAKRLPAKEGPEEGNMEEVSSQYPIYVYDWETNSNLSGTSKKSSPGKSLPQLLAENEAARNQSIKALRDQQRSQKK